MHRHSISQVSERTGFSPSTLRFYEASGLVHPGRTDAGYRSYNEDQVQQLGFIRRAKGFGLSLEEISELLDMLKEDRCAPVQHRLQELIALKIADAEAKIRELEVFVDDLKQVAVSLAEHTPQGACDESCGCMCEPQSTGSEDLQIVGKP